MSKTAIPESVEQLRKLRHTITRQELEQLEANGVIGICPYPTTRVIYAYGDDDRFFANILEQEDGTFVYAQTHPSDSIAKSLAKAEQNLFDEFLSY